LYTIHCKNGDSSLSVWERRLEQHRREKKGMAQVVKNEAGNSRIMDAQGNTIFPCGYRGGAKDRTSAPVEFEEHSVSLSSQVKKQPWGSFFIGRPSRRPFHLQIFS
jgi:hypothetical protein